MTRAQKKEELEQHLFEQIEMLKLSCESFDRGVLFESKRIATGIRVLFHNTKSSHALIEQLGIKNKINYLSTATPYDNKNNKFSRKDIILSVANKDGGAHVDPELEEITII